MDVNLVSSPIKKHFVHNIFCQVARGKTVMIAGHGAFGVENVGNAEGNSDGKDRVFK